MNDIDNLTREVKNLERAVRHANERADRAHYKEHPTFEMSDGTAWIIAAVGIAAMILIVL